MSALGPLALAPSEPCVLSFLLGGEYVYSHRARCHRFLRLLKFGNPTLSYCLLRCRALNRSDLPLPARQPVCIDLAAGVAEYPHLDSCSEDGIVPYASGESIL